MVHPLLIGLSSLAFLCFGALASTGGASDAETARGTGLNRAAQSARKLYFGTATNNVELNDTTYLKIITDHSQFGQITPAKSMKWSFTEPERGVFTFEQGDELVALARRNGMLMRGHNCVWYNRIPDWVMNATWTAPELAVVVQEHCFNIVRHWAGQIWDVINEPFNDDGTWRETIWYNTLNTTYIPLALHAARAADPHAKLYINDFNIEARGPKASALKRLVRDLKRAGVPIHGVGVQAHMTVGQVPSVAEMQANLEEFAALGVEIAITELDVKFATLPPDAAGLAQQARDFAAVVRACVNVERCVGITVWDFTDKYSWIPASFPGMGDACPWDENLALKPAYYGILESLRNK